MRNSEIIKAPPKFKKMLDEARLKAGYNNRERQKFLREACQKDDPFEYIGSFLKEEKDISKGKKGVFDGF
jgi:hypothetical protein